MDYSNLLEYDIDLYNPWADVVDDFFISYFEFNDVFALL